MTIKSGFTKDELIKRLIKINAELLEALKEVVQDLRRGSNAEKRILEIIKSATS